MSISQNNQAFPEQSQPDKLHGTTDESGQKEKYLKDSGKIEDLPEDSGTAKMKSDPLKKRNETAHLTDQSGEEEKEDYINTDERKKDLNQRGL